MKPGLIMFYENIISLSFIYGKANFLPVQKNHFFNPHGQQRESGLRFLEDLSLI